MGGGLFEGGGGAILNAAERRGAYSKEAFIRGSANSRVYGGFFCIKRSEDSR